MYETISTHPLYGPWWIGTRPKRSFTMQMSGRMEKTTPSFEHTLRRTWFAIMNEVCDPRKRNRDVIPNRKESQEDD